MENTDIDMADYVKEGCKIPLEFGGIRTYASINAMIEYDEDGLSPNGEYFIYLLHHRLGSCSFILLQLNDNDQWIPVNAPEGIEDEIFKVLGEAICNRNM